ncbi:MAG: helix-hairpin-helix domain-containing protein [Pseudomonadota bacterium]|nr:helix-hairpin-helix domain-containing protein [Pseudomonadota bacterium]
MTPSNWENDRCRADLRDRQRQGLLLILAATVGIYAGLWAYGRDGDQTFAIPASDARKGPVTVEIAGAGADRAAGIYRLEDNTTLSELLTRIAGLDLDPRTPATELGRILRNGDAVRIDADRRLQVGRMAGATRLALGMPLNINTATREELAMIPGIGEKTARRIMELRRSSPGGIRKLEDLRALQGIKEKRLEKLRRYLTCEGPC